MMPTPSLLAEPSRPIAIMPKITGRRVAVVDVIVLEYYYMYNTCPSKANKQNPIPRQHKHPRYQRPSLAKLAREVSFHVRDLHKLKSKALSLDLNVTRCINSASSAISLRNIGDI